MIGEDINFTTNFQVVFIESLNNVNNKVFDIVQTIAVVHSCLCFFWLVYVSVDLTTLLRNKHIIATTRDHCNYDNKVYTRNENIFRNVIFLMFLTCELVYSLDLNIHAFIVVIYEPTSINIPIGSNCSLDSNSFIGKFYDTRLTNVFLIVFNFLCDISFSMMIWLFGASLLHLSFAARNELRVKAILKFILFGIAMNLFIDIFQILPMTSLFGFIFHSIMNQISLIIVLYIAIKKFFPAMNSRVIDAYHLHNTKLYVQQKRLLKQYKVLVIVFFFTFELFVFTEMSLSNIYAVLNTICSSICWFDVNYHIPIVTLSESTQGILLQIGYFCVVCGNLIILLAYLNIIVVYFNFIYVITRKYIKRKFSKIQYRYNVCSDPLLY